MAEREENIKQKEIPIQELKEQLEQIKSGITSMEHEVSQFLTAFRLKQMNRSIRRSFMSFAQMLMTTVVSTSR